VLAARHRLPAIYPSRLDVAVGGLISYGPMCWMGRCAGWADVLDQYRRVAAYIDHILKGEKPADVAVVPFISQTIVLPLTLEAPAPF
jgi:putative tryptophan/tyrosine transport system substrate-binding protein